MNPPEQAPTDANRWMPHRIGVMLFLLVLAFGGVGFRLYGLQAVEHEKWARRGDGMLKQRVTLPAMRGVIRDSNGELLAHDKLVHEVWVNTQHLRDLNDIRARLAKLQKRPLSEVVNGMKPEDVVQQYREHVMAVVAAGLAECGQPVPADLALLLADEKRIEFPLVKGLPTEQADLWKARLKEGNVLAITLRSSVRRFYPAEERLTHVLGYVNEKITFEDDPVTGRRREKQLQIGREGVEAVLNTELTGTDGFQWVERDRKGREITSFRGEGEQPRNGHEVTLTIDMHLQDTMEQVLEQAFIQYKPKRITAVIVEPRTGAVLAMASRPHIDRETMKGMIANPAISAQYEPGSVFKVVAYTSALDQKRASLGETINVDPSLKVFASQRIKDHVNGPVTVLNAFAQSSNRAAYLLALRVGDDKYLEYVRNFGFGQRSGVDLTGEITGTVWGRKAWDGLTFSRMAMGHAVTVTPLQMAMGVNVIANGGLLMKPQLIKEVKDEQGNIVRRLAPEVVRRVCSEKTAGLMQQAMMEVVQGQKGTGKQAGIDG
ncbi:MAG: peptidoglycan D,D-transpeptidase FtsI family protein, partial [Verrucomicrobium sp.]|nr:penicillin-binding protein 2 [Verrucomicrobium sp.]